jgi:uncharacterized protein
MATEPFACLTCGACCFSRLDRYVRVSGDDYQRLGEAASELALFIENRCYLRLRDGHCSALIISREGAFRCSIYQRRPAICREIEPGGPACRAEIEQKAGRTREALARLRADV